MSHIAFGRKINVERATKMMHLALPGLDKTLRPKDQEKIIDLWEKANERGAIRIADHYLHILNWLLPRK